AGRVADGPGQRAALGGRGTGGRRRPARRGHRGAGPGRARRARKQIEPFRYRGPRSPRPEAGPAEDGRTRERSAVKLPRDAGLVEVHAGPGGSPALGEGADLAAELAAGVADEEDEFPR